MRSQHLASSTKLTPLSPAMNSSRTTPVTMLDCFSTQGIEKSPAPTTLFTRLSTETNCDALWGSAAPVFAIDQKCK